MNLSIQLYSQSKQRLLQFVEMHDIEDFKCILCKQSFLPPYALPYLLPCTHSICTKCLQSSISHHEANIICPQDLQSNSLSDIRTDTSSRRALQRLVREHKNYNQNNQLLCIQSLSKHFEAALEQQVNQRKDFLQLIDQIFRSQMQRLSTQQQRIHQELDTPFKVVKEWKQSLKSYLQSLKTLPRTSQSAEIHAQLSYYIQQGRRIKQQLSNFQNIDYQEMANTLIVCSTACLRSDFSIRQWANQNIIELKKRQKKIESIKEPKLSQSKPSINFTTNSSKKKLNEFISTIKQNIIPKRFVSQPIMQLTKYTAGNIQDQNVMTTCFFKDINKEKLSMLNNIATRRGESQLKQEVLQQLQINGGSKDISSSNSKNLFVYSPDISLNRLHSPIVEYDELLLTEKEEKKWILGNYNFMQQCEIGNSYASQSIEIKKRQPFNWQKESNNYVKRMSLLRAEEAYKNTIITPNSIELINYSLQDVQISLLFQKFDWAKIDVVKLVRANLIDMQLNQLLNFTVNSSITTLVLSGNCLTEKSLDAFLNFTRINTTLRNVYISRNSINCLKGHTRSKINMLRQTGLNLYI